MSHLLAVAYHYVLGDDDGYSASLKGLSTEQFSAQIDLLSSRYKFITSADVPRTPWTDGTARCLITFDDGTRDHFRTAAPILDSRGISAMFFVTTGVLTGEHCIAAHLLHQLMRDIGPEEIADGVNRTSADGRLGVRVDLRMPQSYYHFDDPVSGSLKYQLNHLIEPQLAGRLLRSVYTRLCGPIDKFREAFYMDDTELRALESRGHTVAAHSHAHRNLASAPQDEMERDIERAREVLEESRFERGLAHFAVPFGGAGTYNDPVLAVLKANGFHHVHVAKTVVNTSADGLIYRFGTKQLPPFVEDWPAPAHAVSKERGTA